MIRPSHKPHELRFFAGQITSSSGNEIPPSPAAAVLVTDPLARAARCRVTFFLYFNPAQELRDLLRQQGRELDDGPQWVPVTIQLELKPADMTSGRTVSGTATDPRGWELKYTFCAKDGRVEGTYEQPNDRGTFLLQETT